MNRRELIKGVMQAYMFLREHNHSIPDETLDFIKDAAYEKINKEFPNTETEDFHYIISCGVKNND